MEAGGVIGVGTDIVSITRTTRAVESGGKAFLDRTFTPREQRLAADHARPMAFYAKSFAAKEAVVKTLDVGWDSGIELHEIEVLERDSGQPYAQLHGRAAEVAARAGGTTIQLSVSYEDDYAVAFAVLL